MLYTIMEIFSNSVLFIFPLSYEGGLPKNPEFIYKKVVCVFLHV